MREAGDLRTDAGGRLALAAAAPGRLQTLIDGIFAIAMTLLVLDLRPPADSVTDPAAYAAALLTVTPHFIAFVVGFAVLGVYWVVQHNLFRFIQRVDHAVLWLSILFLIWVSVVPFTTALLGHHPLQRLAILVYALNLVLGWISLWAVWRRATRGGLADPALHPAIRRLISRALLIPPAIYLVAMAISFATVEASYALLALAPIGLIAGIRFQARRTTEPSG
jgi:uncharacterized membrane protein